MSDKGGRGTGQVFSEQFESDVLDWLVELELPVQSASGQHGDVSDDGIESPSGQSGVGGWSDIESDANDGRQFDDSNGVQPREASIGIDVKIESSQHFGPGRGVGGSVGSAFHQTSVGGSIGVGPPAPDVSRLSHRALFDGL